VNSILSFTRDLVILIDAKAHRHYIGEYQNDTEHFDMLKSRIDIFELGEHNRQLGLVNHQDFPDKRSF
jgi:hypothetical protein